MKLRQKTMKLSEKTPEHSQEFFLYQSINSCKAG